MLLFGKKHQMNRNLERKYELLKNLWRKRKSNILIFRQLMDNHVQSIEEGAFDGLVSLERL